MMKTNVDLNVLCLILEYIETLDWLNVVTIKENC